MKRKTGILRNFVAAFAVVGVLLFSANLVFAQCGSFFKTNYRAIDKLDTAKAPILRGWHSRSG
jgi:hypothetical protein